MRSLPTSLRFLLPTTACVCLFSIGCEGINRQHDNRVVDIQPPATDSGYTRASKEEMPNYADLVEEMEASRKAYLDNIMRLERAFLLGGDTTRANWARRQRETTAKVEVFPYLSDKAPEQRTQVAPTENIPAADAMYKQAADLIESFRNIPLAGTFSHNKKKARKALDMFKQILNDYPTSDKVDDAAFWCGEIYKEYLREDDPDDELSVRYYTWAYNLDPQTPHPARFMAAVVYDFRMHDRAKAIELYHKVLEAEEDNNSSNQRFAATRIEQLTDDDRSHLRPEYVDASTSDEEREPSSTSASKGSDTAKRPAASTEPKPATAKLPEEDENN